MNDDLLPSLAEIIAAAKRRTLAGLPAIGPDPDELVAPVAPVDPVAQAPAETSPPEPDAGPDLEAARAHIAALTGSPDTPMTFQTYDDNKDRSLGDLVSVPHGTIADRFAQLSSLNARGAGVFVTVNETDFKARTKRNIVRLRAVGLDFDNGDVSTYIVPPSFIVRSKAGPQPYLMLRPDEYFDIERFEKCQKRIAERLGADTSAVGVERVLRLAGFDHRKIDKQKGLTGEPFRVTFEGGPGTLYTLDDLMKAHHIPEQTAETSPAPKKNAPANRPPGQITKRNVLLYQIAKDAKRAGADDREVAAFVKAANAALPYPLPDRELEATVLSSSNVRETTADEGDVPTIEIGKDDTVNVNAAVTTIKTLEIYSRGDALVQVGGSPVRVHALTKPALQEKLSHAARYASWVGVKGGGTPRLQEILPPTRLAEMILARPAWQWPFRILVALSDTPILRPDGSIVQEKGYDPDTRVYYDPAGATFPEIPEHPTRQQVQDALQMLADLVSDFPWVDPGDPPDFRSSDRSAAIAALLSLLGRSAIDGPLPLFALRAPAVGTGKGLLADLISIIATGAVAKRQVLSGGEEEIRKMILGYARSGDRQVLLDNFTGTMESPALAAALTSEVWSDRILGKSETAREPLRAAWFVTGNNILFSGELARRVVPIDQDAQVEDPQNRDGFRIPDIKAYTRSHRSELVAAGLTILRGYFNAGRPPHGQPPMGSFEAWDRLIRGALIWAGEADPCAGCIRVMADSNVTSESLARMLTATRDALDLRKHFGPFTVKELLLYAPEDSDLRDAIREWRYGARDPLDAQGLGYAIKAARGAIAAGLRFVPGEFKRGRSATWTVEDMKGRR